jgi:hypothetical protein
MPANSVPSIGQNVLTELVLQVAVLIDYKALKLSDVDLHVISVKQQGVRQFGVTRTNPDRQLVRYQFMELIYRIGIERFKNLKPS